jgi:hypothetical protein
VFSEYLKVFSPTHTPIFEDCVLVSKEVRPRCGGAVIRALGRLRQKDGEFEASLGYVAKPYFQKKERNFILMSPSH